ncbi:MAG TPA: DUF664 domain-containing protein [Actinomycetota bacterium]
MTDPTIAAARDILSDSLDELRKAVDGCTADELNRRPAGDDTNGLAVLVTHAMGSTRAWLSVAVGAPLPERDRDAEFLVVVEDPGAFLATFDAAAGQCRSLLATDAPFDPGRVGTAPWRTYGSDEPVTAAWALLHAVEHLREHVGHAQLTRQILG